MIDEADEELVTALRVVIRLSRIAQIVCEKNGLTLPQYRALAIAVTSRRAHEIASMSSVSRPAVAAMTAGLAKMGLLVRTTAEHDRRGAYFVATEEGRAAVERIEEDVVLRLRELLGDDIDLLTQLPTARIEEALDAEIMHSTGPRSSAEDD